MKNTEEQVSLWNKSYIFLIVTNLFTAMGFNMVYVMISNYAMTVQASLAIAGLISGVFSIAALIVRPFAGMSADLLNKKNLCILSNIIMGLSVVGYGFSDQISILLFFRILHGIAFGLNSTTNIALVTEYVPKERMGEGLGYYGIGQVIAQVIGPNLGLIIVERMGFQPLFLITASFSFIAVFMLLFFSYPKHTRGKDMPPMKLTLHSFVAKEVIVYTMVGGMFSFSNGIVNSFLILLGKERQIANVGIFFSVGAIVLFGVRLLIGRLVDKKGLTLIVNISLLITSISMVIIGAAPALSWLIVASVLKALGQGTGQISLQTECVKRVDPGRIGVAMSTFYIGADIGQGLGPIFGGEISDRYNYLVMYSVCAAFLLFTMLIFNIYQKQKRHN